MSACIGQRAHLKGYHWALPRQLTFPPHLEQLCRQCHRTIPVTRHRLIPALRSVADEAVAVMEVTDAGGWDRKFGAIGPLSYGARAEQGPRETMEDFVTVVPRGNCGFLYAGVFDGHQGPGAAAYLSEHLYEGIAGSLQQAADSNSGTVGKLGRAVLDLVSRRNGQPQETPELFYPSDLTKLLKDSFVLADKEVLAFLHSQEVREDQLAGCTATVLLVRQDKLAVANVGDSRAILSRGGAPVQVSTEHRVYGDGDIVQQEIDRVESTGGWIDDGRVCDILAVSRAFGDTEFKGEGLQGMLAHGVEDDMWTQEFADSVHFTSDPVVALPDVTELDRDEDDEFIVLATDGLWDVMSNKDVVQWGRKEFDKGRTAQQVADMLATMALRKHTLDNVSVVVVDLGGGKQGWLPPDKRRGQNPFMNMFKG
ncbi:hypothetical protein WJX73_000453 [Symbiochloris irregularis]|uniref:PPM-type phosphatase domain-containing protein n=1 Tax=Symbiochloris irregularis TaxID=706552 RepID=A0AAW1PQ18_9CHLO